MRSVSGILVPAVLCALTLLQAGEDALPGLESVPDVVADVNGRPIKRNDLVREMVGAGGTEGISRLVQRILIEQSAKEKGVVVSVQDEDQQLNADKIALSSELLQTPWAKTPPEEIIRAHYGMTTDEYKNLVIRQRLLTRRSVGGGAAPSDDELMAFFAKENELFQPQVRYHAQHILLSPFEMRDLYRSLRMARPEAQMDAYNSERRWRINKQRDEGITFKDEQVDLDPVWQRSKQLADRVLREIKTGVITFEAAVVKYTQDPVDHPTLNPQVDNQRKTERERAGMKPGDVGWFTKKGPMVDQFFNGVKNMKPGEIAGPIRTPYGYHIVKMLEISTPPMVTFEACKEAVFRAKMERSIAEKADAWMKELEDKAVIRVDRSKLWPPARRNAVVLPDAGATEQKAEEADPVVATVNGVNIKRSEVWRELVRSDGEDALKRLVNMEVVLTLLKSMGLDRLDWECADPTRRAPQPPPAHPISIPVETIDLELNDIRLRHDVEAPNTDFRDYLFAKYGQSVDEYKRKMEASLILLEAIRRKIKTDDGTLQVQFALAKEQYVDPEWYEISHILIVPTGGMQKADQNAQLQALNMITEAYKTFQASPSNETFTQLARDWSMEDRSAIKSRDGKLGACHPDLRNPDLPEGPTIYNEIRRQKLEKGQVSAPIKTFRGYHIVRVDARHPQMPAIFENVKKRVERDYLNERAKMYTDIWLRALNTKAQIKKFMYNRPDDLKFETGRPDYFPIPKE